ncbi:hypothetical protein NVS55_09400 [Myxococcus stipitatus]|uniref:hypothetical protein n=1 Tax=Myxococcus stipitatus TaxID=83455 RepID=UPI0031454A3A
MLPLLLSLLVAAGASPSPESSSANLQKTSAFQDWRRRRFLVAEHWVDLPEAGLRVGYFVVPSPWTVDQVPEPLFHDAFFVLDPRTGQLVAPPLVRTSLPTNGCPKMGEVERLFPEPRSKTSAAVRFGKDPQRCLLQLERKQESWVLSLFPDETRSAQESFPKAAVALEKALGPQDGGSREFTWAYVPNSRWLFAAPREGLALWAVDSVTSKVNTTASEAMTRKIRECVDQVFPYPAKPARQTDLPRTVERLEWSDGGSGLFACECVVAQGGEADLTCRAYSGRDNQPLDGEEAPDDDSPSPSSPDPDLSRLEDLHRMRKELLALNEATLTQWSTGQKKEALSAWTAAYRAWLADGRQVAGDPLNWRHREYIRSDILRPQVDEQRAAIIDLWAELLNNLGFALWYSKEWLQAQAVLDDCLVLLTTTNHERDVLHLNRGDLARDLGKVSEAIEYYRYFLLSRKIPAAQRKYAEKELRKLEQRSK